jgi:hypothetical protein
MYMFCYSVLLFLVFIFKLNELTPDSGHSVTDFIILHFPDGKLYSRTKKQWGYNHLVLAQCEFETGQINI